MKPDAIARLRILRAVGVLRLKPRTSYAGLTDLSTSGMIRTWKGRDGGINCGLTDFGRRIAATIPPEGEHAR